MKRYPKRAVHDKAPIHAILDEVRGPFFEVEGFSVHSPARYAPLCRHSNGAGSEPLPG